MFSKAKVRIAAVGATLASLLPASNVFASGATEILQKQTKTSNGSMKDFSTMILAFVDPLQAIATACLICVAVILGLKIGAASVAGDPRSRTSSIVGLFFVVIGEFVILNAGAVVAIVTNIK